MVHRSGKLVLDTFFGRAKPKRVPCIVWGTKIRPEDRDVYQAKGRGYEDLDLYGREDEVPDVKAELGPALDT